MPGSQCAAGCRSIVHFFLFPYQSWHVQGDSISRFVVLILLFQKAKCLDLAIDGSTVAPLCTAFLDSKEMAVNIIFYLIPLAAASWNSESSTSSAVSQRRTQALPAGYEIHELLNGSIPLIVIPTWDVFLGYSDAKKFIKGRMSIDVVYPEAAETFVERPENMVDIPNFGSGSGEINTLSQIKLWDPTTEQTATSVGKVYVGEFSQSLYPYDACVCVVGRSFFVFPL